MKDFITNMFNLEPRIIHDIEIISSDNAVFAIISLRKADHLCPVCKNTSSNTHSYRKRSITHSILNGLDTTIVYNQRRYICPVCGKVFPERNPFAMPGRRISKYTILRVMNMLKDPRVTFAMAAKEASVSVTTAERIFDAHVGISSMPLPDILCMDEVYAVKYHQKVYACVLADFKSSQIYDLLPDRKKYTLAKYFSSISRDTRKTVKYVSMDMWDTYRDIASVYLPDAKICVDSFHVIALINRAFTKVRIRLMNSFDRKSDEYYLLKKYTWLLNKAYREIPSNQKLYVPKYIPDIGRKHILARELVNLMLEFDPELEVAYMLKEDYLDINRDATEDDIEGRLDHYIKDLKIFSVPEFMTVAGSLSKWHNEIINSFDRVDGRRISNGPVESINSRIQLLKASAAGYRNFDRFRKRVLYSLNKNSSIKF